MKNEVVTRVTKTLPFNIVFCRGLMKKKRVTARKAAEELGTSYSNISKVLTGILKSKSLEEKLMNYLRDIPSPSKPSRRRKISTSN
ncbi:hypothetical protein [Akkermansia muciniphila]|uniref:hypothetical protein n=1 Tax=Akkermansia muciniphila TaxID=239935 RepID=UPI001C52E6C9|nr:hypothetical protein [Akkermansia muciniphila]